MTPTDWMIGLTLAFAAFAVATFSFYLGRASAGQALKNRAAWAELDESHAREEFEFERAAHEATTLRCSDAEERLAQISLLAAPKAE